MNLRRIARLILFSITTTGTLVYALDNKSQQLQKIQKRAEDILKKNEMLELSMADARKKVQQILEELKSWSELHNVKLSTRERTFANPLIPRNTILSTDKCALFFEDNKLCPIDLSHSEVWGLKVLHCRYLCAISDESKQPDK